MLSLRARRLLDEDRGFSILESTVALVIIFGVVLVLLRALDTGVRVLVETRRQAAASALANELIERARSLEWGNTGLVSLANDSDCPPTPPDGVAGVDCATWSTELGIGTNASGNYTFEGNEIVFLNGPTFAPFLSFHDDVLRDNTDFDRYIFVSSIRTDPVDPATEQWRKITAIVQWTPPSGFRRQVREVTYVSLFEEPSQPYLKGIVTLDGGFIAIGGTEAGERGRVPGSARWAVGGSARSNLKSTVSLPDSEVVAVSDYVAQASVDHIGTSGEFDWSDGTVYAVGSETFQLLADDDFGSSPPESVGSTNHSFTGWNQDDPLNPSHDDPPRDIRARERLDASDTQDESKVWAAQVAVDHSLLGGGDELPYASSELRSAEALRVRFTEYGAGVEALFQSLLGHGFDENSYDFELFRMGDSAGETVRHWARVDRYEGSPITSTRRVDVNYEWQPDVFYSAFDEVYFEAIDSDFRGWVRVLLPDVAGDVHAGEAPGTNDMTPTGGVELSYWDPTSRSYVQLPGCSASYDVLSISGPETCAVNIDFTMPDSNNHPELHYTLEITLTVNRAFAPAGTPEEVVHEVPNIVTGTVAYRVEDVEIQEAFLLGLVSEDGLLYDVDLSFGLGGVRASALYVEPVP